MNPPTKNLIVLKLNQGPWFGDNNFRLLARRGPVSK
jgi:hypothetical protein